MKRLQELTTGYSPENIWNMDKSGCSFKALPDKGLAEKYEKNKKWQKLKSRFTVT